MAMVRYLAEAINRIQLHRLRLLRLLNVLYPAFREISTRTVARYPASLSAVVDLYRTAGKPFPTNDRSDKTGKITRTDRCGVVSVMVTAGHLAAGTDGSDRLGTEDVRPKWSLTVFS